MKNKVINIIAGLLALLLWLFATFAPIPTNADEVGEATGVMQDLQSAENFDAWEYPSVADDYSLQVIQIAESAQGRLYVYVYQPSHWTKDLQATTLRVGLPQMGVETTYKDYTLKLTSTAGVFDKYEVTGLEIPTGAARYYELVAIHRAFDGSIDDEPDTETEQETQEVVYEVAQTWRAETTESGVKYAVSVLDVIEVTAKVVGYITYEEGFKFYLDYCDSHFVAFSTDRNIETLKEADVEYITQEHTRLIDPTLPNGGAFTSGEEVKQTKYLTADQTGSGGGFFGNAYRWERIEKTADFLASEGSKITFTEGAKADIEKTQWILRFDETARADYVNFSGSTTEYTSVNSVTILRLKFETAGVTYNLGVVDNKQSGGQMGVVKDDMAWWIYVLICAAVVLVFLFVVLPLLRLIFGILDLPARFVDWLAGLGGK